jgi:hypothetical protein
VPTALKPSKVNCTPTSKGEVYMDVAEAMGQAMVELLKNK